MKFLYSDEKGTPIFLIEILIQSFNENQGADNTVQDISRPLGTWSHFVAQIYSIHHMY